MERDKRFERIRVGFTLNLEPDVEKQKKNSTGRVWPWLFRCHGNYKGGIKKGSAGLCGV